MFYAKSTINSCMRVTQLWDTSDGSMDEGSVYQIIFSNRPVSQNKKCVGFPVAWTSKQTNMPLETFKTTHSNRGLLCFPGRRFVFATGFRYEIHHTPSTNTNNIYLLVCWCFEPIQPHGVTSGLYRYAIMCFSNVQLPWFKTATWSRLTNETN